MNSARLIALLALLFVVAPLSWAQETQTLTGIVTSEDGLPLDSAVVEVTEPWVDTDTTDADGFYEVSGMVPTSSDQSPAITSFGVRSVSPNPFSGRVELCASIPSTDELETVVYDVLGRVVYRDTRSVVEGNSCWGLYLTGMADGVYSIVLRMGKVSDRVRVTHLDGAPSASGSSSATKPVPPSASQRTGGDDLSVSIARIGFMPFTADVPAGTTEQDFVLSYANNSQPLVVRDDDGGFVTGATVSYDFDADGQPNLSVETDGDGEAVAWAEYYGPAAVRVEHPSLSGGEFETFFGAGSETFVVDNLPWSHTLVVSDVSASPIESATVEGDCTVNGVDYGFSTTTDASGQATISLPIAGLRGGAYEAECAGTVERATYVSESISAVLADGASTDITLDRLGFVELYALPLLDHFGSVGDGFMRIGADTVFDVNGNLLPDGRVSIDADGAARFYVNAGDFTVDPETANHNGGFVVWNEIPRDIPHYANGREDHRMYDKIVRVDAPGLNTSDVFTAYIANDDWQAAEDGMAMFLTRLAGNNWENFPLRCYNIYENGFPYTAFPTEDVDGTIYEPLPENVEAAGVGLDTLAALYVSRTNAVLNVRQVPIAEYDEQVIGVTAFDLGPPGQNSSSIDPNTGLILNPKWISPSQFAVLASGALDEIIDTILGPDFGQVFAVAGPNGQIIIPDDIADQLFASYTYGCMENAYDG